MSPAHGGHYVLLIIMTVAACGQAPQPVAFSAPSSRAGTLRLVDGTLRFASCGEEGSGVAIQDLGDGIGAALVRELGADGIPALLRLDGNRLEEIRYAGPEGSCDRLPPDADVEARGNEPFWVARVADASVVVLTPENPTGTTYREGRWSRTASGGWRFDARSSGEPIEPLTLELVQEGCSDSMSAARYPFRAHLTRGGTRLEGCALEGRR